MIGRRLHRKTRERTALWVGAVAGATVIGLLLALSVTVQNGIPGNKGAVLTLEFASAGNVNRYDDVRVAGRRVGGVASLTYNRGRALVKVRLEDGLEGLRDSTTARIRLNGLIGAQYVELIPGRTGAPLRANTTIPMARTSTNPDLFSLLAAFDKNRVADLRAIFQGLGGGFADRGEGANRAIGTTPALLTEADKLLDALGANRAALRRFVPAAASFAEALEPVREEIASGFDAGERSIRPFADRSAALRDSLRESARLVDEATEGLPAAQPLLDETKRFAGAVEQLSSQAPAALREATSLLRASGRPLRASTPLLRQARASVGPLLRLLRAAAPLVDPLGRSMSSSLPLLREIGRRVCDIDTGMGWLKSVPAYGTPAGHLLGANNVVRVFDSGGTEFVSEIPDTPAKAHAKDENPAPCTAGEQKLGGEG